jgi:NADH-quinone oxidoreductase subunit C
MNLSKTEHIAHVIENEIGVPVEVNLTAKQPFIRIEHEYILKVCTTLFSSKEFYFDFLNCITCVDNGADKGTMDLIYHLTSIPLEHSVILKTEISREESEISSVSSVWRSAEWHEREIFDLFGVKFTDHPDLRRILMPADWEGFPLRKDYKEQQFYHGIKVKYEK